MTRQTLTNHRILAGKNELDITLPPSILKRAGLSNGDWIEVVEVDGGIKLVPADREFVEQMAVAERVMDENRDLLKRLADS